MLAGEQLLLLGGSVTRSEENTKIFTLVEDRWVVKGVLEQQHVFFSALCIGQDVIDCQEY